MPEQLYCSGKVIFCITDCLHPHSRWVLVSGISIFRNAKNSNALNRLKPILKRVPSKCLKPLNLLNNFNYSIIAATRPEPTVCPPSRFVGNIIIMLFHIFHWILCLYSPISVMLFEIFKFFRTKIEPRHNNNIVNHTLIYHDVYISFRRLNASSPPSIISTIAL